MILENNESHDFAGFCCVINVVVALFFLMFIFIVACFIK